jgi:hypothetical protein
MSLLVLLLALNAPAAPSIRPLLPAPRAAEAPAQDLKAEYETRRAAAEGNKEKLWELAAWCESNGLDKERKSCLREIVKLDDNDAKAHEALGHILYEGKWFTSEDKLAAYKQKAAEKAAKEQGLVPYKDGFARPEDIPVLDKGLVKDPEGKWVDPEDLKHIQEGWKLQDLTWIPPAEFDKLDAGLWKCGEEWKPLAEADAYHGEIGRWWRLPGTYYHVYTTLPRAVALQAVTEVDRTYTDLARIYGVEPSEPIMVVLLRSVEQYSTFAAGGDGWPGTDKLGLSSVHGAFFADGLFDSGARKWMGCGAGYWDPKTEDTTRFGKLFARHAAGQSFGEAVDPSPKALAKQAASPQGELNFEDFYAEKKVPAWFRYGAASYVERYYVDAYLGQGGDPLWARKWSIENIARRGGLDGLPTIFELKIGPDVQDSDKLISETGLLVAFILDGDCAPVKKAHQEVKDALKAGENPASAFKALEAALDKNADKLRAFANL